MGDAPEDKADDQFDLKRRLAEERRKHRLDHEEQFEDDLDDEDLLYDDYLGDYDFDDYDDEYYYDEDEDDDYDYDYDSEDEEYSYDDELDDGDDYGKSTGLDYYYDDQGFAHPVRPKSKFGYEKYRDAYNYHLDPRRNK